MHTVILSLTTYNKWQADHNLQHYFKALVADMGQGQVDRGILDLVEVL
jgi:hypothetical protein